MATKYQRGLVPLSADPITFGHLDLIARAAELCHEVVVYVSNSGHKRGKYLFTLGERRAFVADALRQLARPVRVIAGEDLLADVFMREGCDTLIRGIRNEADERYEDEQVAYHALIYPPIADQVVYLRARPELALVSSSAVKAFVSYGVDVSRHVPTPVKAALEARITGRYFLGVTGRTAVGKSSLARAIVSVCSARGVPAVHVDVDALSRAALFGRTPGSAALRTTVAELVGDDDLFTGAEDAVLTRFRAAFFGDALDPLVREQVHAVMVPHVNRLYRDMVRDHAGVVVYDWAQLVEMDLFGLVNNAVAVIDSPDQRAFASARGIGNAQFAYLCKVQWDAVRKERMVRERIARDGFGHVVAVRNTRTVDICEHATQVVGAFVRAGMLPEALGEGEER